MSARYYLDTSVLIEAWTGERAVKDEITELLRTREHAASSTHVRREWKGIINQGTARVLNAIRDGANLNDLLARLSQGRNRDPKTAMRVMTLLTHRDEVSPAGALGPEMEIRARAILNYRSDAMFEYFLDEIRDASDCGLARNEVRRDQGGDLRLKDTCKKTDEICRHIDFVGDKLAQWTCVGTALRDGAPRDHDRNMGKVVLSMATDPPARKGRNCYGRTGDIAIALECEPDETVLTTDQSFETICPALGLSVRRMAATRTVTA